MLNTLRSLWKRLTRRRVRMRIRSYRGHPPFPRTPSAIEEEPAPEQALEQPSPIKSRVGPPGKQGPFRRRNARTKQEHDTESGASNRASNRPWIGAPGKKLRPVRGRRS